MKPCTELNCSPALHVAAERLDKLFNLSTPPVENSAPSGASEVKDGQGVCTLTIDQPYARMYVDGVAKLYLSSSLLLAAWKKSNKRSGYQDTPYGDALFDGYRSIFHDLNDWVKHAQRHGVLLHLVPA